MPAPSYTPDVDNNGTNQPADPSGIPAAIKADGFLEKQNVPNTWWNWLFKTINEWITWSTTLWGVEHDASDGTHTDITCDSIDVDGGGDVDVTGAGGVYTSGGGNIGSDGSLWLKRGVSGGDAVLVGGVQENANQQINMGTSSTSEEEGQQYVIPAGTLKAGTIVRLSCYLDVDALTSNELTFRWRFGNAAAFASRVELASFVNVFAAANNRVLVRTEFRVRTAGPTMVAEGLLDAPGVDASGNPEHFAGLAEIDVADAEDTTADIYVSPTIQFANSYADTGLQIRWFLMEVLGN